MNKPEQPTLVKTCSACGQQKSLSAFLQISGTEGSSYGNICSTCRKADLGEPKEKTDAEKGTTGETTQTIDTKSKMVSDKQARNHEQKVEEEYHKERDELDMLELEKEEKKDHFLLKQKEHRTSFLDKRSNIGADKKAETKNFADKAEFAEKKQQVDYSLKDEKKKKTVDFSVPYIAPQMGEAKYKSAEHQKVLVLFGKGNAVAKKLSSVFKNPEKHGVTPTDSAEEFIENNWQGPGSGKSR